jgi:hypothetical protein
MQDMIKPAMAPATAPFVLAQGINIPRENTPNMVPATMAESDDAT